jgi:hypothetical protein
MPRETGDSNGAASQFETMVEGTVPPSQAMEVADDADTTPIVATTWLQEPTYEANEVQFPRLRLGQGLTPEVAEGSAKMGQWLLAGYEALDEVTIIPLMMGRTRFKRKDPANRDSPVGCQSPDGVQGYGDPGIKCKGCAFAKWKPAGQNGKNSPPDCTITYRYAAWVAEHESIAEVIFQRTSEQYAYFINNLQQRYKFGGFAIKLTSTMKSNGQRRWAEPQLKLAPVTQAMKAAAGTLIPGNEEQWDDEAPEESEVLDATSVPV